MKSEGSIDNSMDTVALPELEKTRWLASICNCFARFFLLAFLALLLSSQAVQHAIAGSNTQQSSRPVKHLILIIADGMQLEHERAANMYLFGNHVSGLAQWDFDYKGAAATWDVTTYNRYAVAEGKGMFPGDGSARAVSTFIALLGYDPARGGSAPYPIDISGDPAYYGARLNDGTPGRPKYPGTDSASAATALATGFKTDDGNISWRTGDPDDGNLATIAEMCRRQGKAAIGIVSTVPFSHATPAAFVSHNKSRKNIQEIATEIMNEFKPDVVISGGHPLFFSSDPAEQYRFIPSRLFQGIRNKGEFVIAERIRGLDGGTTLAQKADEAVRRRKKLFGLFGGSGGNFEYHRPSNDGTSLVNRGSTENPTLAKAAEAALKVLSRNPNGFFLMIEQGDIDWSNHDNDFAGMIGGVWDLNEAVKAVEAFVDRPGDELSWQNTLLIVTADHANSFMRISVDPAKQLGKGRLPNQKRKASDSGRTPYGVWTYPNGEISYGFDGKGVNSHTNEPVTVYARGAGSQLFKGFEGAWYPGTRLMDNTHIFEVMLKVLGLKDENRTGNHPCVSLQGDSHSRTK
ncbi:MAG: alkaline phosphatase [Geobacteraceae bacterium]|nr:alkaline phosphatase [Geobacteraceae bacterium]